MKLRTASRFALLMALSAVGSAFARPVADTQQLERGRYLATAADCTGCHTRDASRPMAGGVGIPTPFGTVFSPNITPDRDTGIGGWSDEEFYRAMHDGIGKHGENLYPAFPYDAFTKLSPGDVRAIKTYLFSLAPIHEESRDDALAFPFNQRWTLSFWKLFNFHEGSGGDDSSPNDTKARGAYLVEALAHCGTCHTPRTFAIGTDSRRSFAGADVGGWWAPNITPDPISGIGGWRDEELEAYLGTAVAVGKGDAADGMGEAVEHSLSKLSAQDIHAIVVYLRAQRPVRDPAEARPRFDWGQPREDVTAFRGRENLDQPDGRALYYGACSSCHGVDGSGSRDHAFPSLFHNTAAGGDNANNLVKVILDGVHRTVGGVSVSMPAFRDQINDGEVALIANYVIETYGNPRTAVAGAALVGALRSDQGHQPIIARLLSPWVMLLAALIVLSLVWWLLATRSHRNRLR